MCMASEKRCATVELPKTKEEIREAVYGHFDVSIDVRPCGKVFADGDRALGSQNTTGMPNGNAQPKDDKNLIIRDQVPVQMIEIYGPIEGSVKLAKSWIEYGNSLVDDELRTPEKACLINQAVEKYGFNMWAGEIAAAKAVYQEFGYKRTQRDLEQIIDDETKGGRTGKAKADEVFKNGKTLQVKVGRSKYEKCDMKAKVEPNGNGTADVTIWER